jgi:hypothetical protein
MILFTIVVMGAVVFLLRFSFFEVPPAATAPNTAGSTYGKACSMTRERDQRPRESQVGFGHAEPGVDPQRRPDDLGEDLAQRTAGVRPEHAVDEVAVGQRVLGEDGPWCGFGRG